jgi:hypothetical protein
MKANFQNKISVVLLLLISQFSFAQKKEQIGTETVNVVKPYVPAISDAFKAKEATPSAEEEEMAKKEVVKYSIFSFPVASTFTPSKGKAEGVEQEKQVHLFKNYASIGVGNYGRFIGELFVNEDINTTDYVAGMLRHHSSQGGIKNVVLNDKFYDTSIDLTYGSNKKETAWNIDLGYQNQIYNWYGLPAGFGSILAPEARITLIDGINPQQAYNTITAGGRIDFNEGFFDKATVKYNHFSDAFGSSENRFYAKPSLQFDVMDRAVKTNLIVDYVGGSFKKDYLNTNSLKYGFTNFGIEPVFIMQEDDWTLNIGAGLFYSLDLENKNSKFLVYPKINASYKVVDDLMILYVGAEGNLEQNSYQGFVGENPFLSPTLNIAPTDRQYDIFAGLKGKLTNTVSYNVKGSYAYERNRALFKGNEYDENAIDNADYAFGNSFQVVYDDMRTVRFYGEFKADFSDSVSFGIDGTFSSYTNDSQIEAWNLPSVKINSSLDFNITEKWFAVANIFYVGERKDLKIRIDRTNQGTQNPITLSSYFDANVQVGFKYSDLLTFYLKTNNITNKAYEKWLDYPVQGFQAVIGANYKFDF